MLSLQDIDQIILNGGIVVDTVGEKIGSVEQIFTGGDSGEPVFVTVRTGLFGMSESFAPLAGAILEESVIRLAYVKDAVKNGPRIDRELGTITEAQERELYDYYGLAVGASDMEGDPSALAEEPSPGARPVSGVAAQEPPHPHPLGGPPRLPHLHKHVPPPRAHGPGPTPPHHPPRHPRDPGSRP